MISHISVASITRTPELVLDQSEADGLAESTLTLLSLYDIRPDPKIEAIIALAAQVGITYGTRIVAIKARKAQEAKEKEPGIAGVYGADGAPAGTTSYASQEWPLGGAAVQ